MEKRICRKDDDEKMSLEWKRDQSMDGDSGDKVNEELTCERSDKSDSLAAGRRSSLGS